MNPVLAGNRVYLFNHPYILEIYLLGKISGYDWNIKILRNHQQPDKKKIVELAKKLNLLAHFYDVTSISAPRPTLANGVVVEQKDFVVRGSLPGAQTKLLQGVNADGVVFDSCSKQSEKSAFWISSADCPTVIALGKNGYWGAAHCARDSILNNVTSSLVESLYILGEDISKLVVTICLGIRSENFGHPWNHPKFGNRNKKMVSEIISKWGEDCITGDITLGKLDLFSIICTQLTNLGVNPQKITADTFDTFSDEVNSKHMWWSARRGDTGRNGVFVAPMIV